MDKAATKAAPAAPKPPEVEYFHDVEQRSPEWFELRRGVPTASEFAAILANGKGRDRLLYRLAGEIISGEISETFTNAAMERGRDMEAELRDTYARTHFAKLTPCGFARRRLPSGRFAGCSPDSLIGEDSGLEIKSMRPDLLIELIEKCTAPTEHKAQLHGSMWVTGRASWNLSIGYRGMPAMSYRFQRDDAFIKQISDAVEVFDFDLHKLVEKVRRMTK